MRARTHTCILKHMQNPCRNKKRARAQTHTHKGQTANDSQRKKMYFFRLSVVSVLEVNWMLLLLFFFIVTNQNTVVSAKQSTTGGEVACSCINVHKCILVKQDILMTNNDIQRPSPDNTCTHPPIYLQREKEGCTVVVKKREENSLTDVITLPSP